MKKKFFLGTCSLVLFLLVASYAFEQWAIRSELETLKVKGKLIQVAGASMHIQCLGSGSPVVILESGLGSDMTSWDKVVHPVLMLILSGSIGAGQDADAVGRFDNRDNCIIILFQHRVK